jgi:hypothetical protein
MKQFFSQTQQSRIPREIERAVDLLTDPSLPESAFEVQITTTGEVFIYLRALNLSVLLRKPYLKKIGNNLFLLFANANNLKRNLDFLSAISQSRINQGLPSALFFQTEAGSNFKFDAQTSLSAASRAELLYDSTFRYLTSVSSFGNFDNFERANNIEPDKPFGTLENPLVQFDNYNLNVAKYVGRRLIARELNGKGNDVYHIYFPFVEGASNGVFEYTPLSPDLVQKIEAYARANPQIVQKFTRTRFHCALELSWPGGSVVTKIFGFNYDKALLTDARPQSTPHQDIIDSLVKLLGATGNVDIFESGYDETLIYPEFASYEPTTDTEKFEQFWDELVTDTALSSEFEHFGDKRAILIKHPVLGELRLYAPFVENETLILNNNSHLELNSSLNFLYKLARMLKKKINWVGGKYDAMLVLAINPSGKLTFEDKDELVDHYITSPYFAAALLSRAMVFFSDPSTSEVFTAEVDNEFGTPESPLPRWFPEPGEAAAIVGRPLFIKDHTNSMLSIFSLNHVKPAYEEISLLNTETMRDVLEELKQQGKIQNYQIHDLHIEISLTNGKYVRWVGRYKELLLMISPETVATNEIPTELRQMTGPRAQTLASVFCIPKEHEFLFLDLLEVKQLDTTLPHEQPPVPYALPFDSTVSIELALEEPLQSLGLAATFNPDHRDYHVIDEHGTDVAKIHILGDPDQMLLLNCLDLSVQTSPHLENILTVLFQKYKVPIFLVGAEPYVVKAPVQEADSNSVAIVNIRHEEMLQAHRVLASSLVTPADLTIANSAMWNDIEQYMLEKTSNFSSANHGYIGVYPLRLRGLELNADMTFDTLIAGLEEISARHHTPIFLGDSGDYASIAVIRPGEELAAVPYKAFILQDYFSERVQFFQETAECLADFENGLIPKSQYIGYWAAGGRTLPEYFNSKTVFSEEDIQHYSTELWRWHSSRHPYYLNYFEGTVIQEGKEVNYVRILDSKDSYATNYWYRALELACNTLPSFNHRVTGTHIFSLINLVDIISELNLLGIKRFRAWAIAARNVILQDYFVRHQEKLSALSSDEIFDCLFPYIADETGHSRLYTFFVDRTFWTSFDAQELFSKKALKQEQRQERQLEAQKSRISLPDYQKFQAIGRSLADSLLEHRLLNSSKSRALVPSDGRHLDEEDDEIAAAGNAARSRAAQRRQEIEVQNSQQTRRNKLAITTFMASYNVFEQISPTQKEILAKQSVNSIHNKIKLIIDFALTLSRRLPDNKTRAYVDDSVKTSDYYLEDIDKLLELPFIRWLITLDSNSDYGEQFSQLSKDQPQNIWLVLKYVVFALTTKQLLNRNDWVYNFLAAPLTMSLLEEQQAGLQTLAEKLSARDISQEDPQRAMRKKLYEQFAHAERNSKTPAVNLTARVYALGLEEERFVLKQEERAEALSLIRQFDRIDIPIQSRALSFGSKETEERLRRKIALESGVVIYNNTKVTEFEQPYAISGYTTRHKTHQIIKSLDLELLRNARWRQTLALPKKCLVEMHTLITNPIYPKELGWKIDAVFNIDGDETHEAQQGDLGEIYLPEELLGQRLLIVHSLPEKSLRTVKVRKLKYAPEDRCEFLPNPNLDKLALIRTQALKVFGQDWPKWVKEMEIRQETNQPFNQQSLQQLVERISSSLLNKIFNKAYYDFDYYTLNNLDPATPLSPGQLFNSLASGAREGVYCDATAQSIVGVLEALFGEENVHYVLSHSEEIYDDSVLTKVDHIRVLIGNIQLDLTPSRKRAKRREAIRTALAITKEEASIRSSLLDLGKALKKKLLYQADSLATTFTNFLPEKFSSQLPSIFGAFLVTEIAHASYERKEIIDAGVAIATKISRVKREEIALASLEENAVSELTAAQTKFVRELSYICAFGNLEPAQLVEMLRLLNKLELSDSNLQRDTRVLPLENPELLRKEHNLSLRRILAPSVTPETLITEVRTLSDIAVFEIAAALQHDGAVSLETRKRLMSEAKTEVEDIKGLPNSRLALEQAQTFIKFSLSNYYAEHESIEELFAYIYKLKQDFGVYHDKHRHGISQLRHTFSPEQKSTLHMLVNEGGNPVIRELIRTLL